MKIVALIHGPEVIKRILSHLKLGPTDGEPAKRAGGAASRDRDAIASYEAALRLSPGHPQVQPLLDAARAKRQAATPVSRRLADGAAALARGDYRAAAEAYEEGLEAIDADAAARLRERAFRHLRQAVDLGYADVEHMAGDADLAPLHGDARWAELLQSLRR